jgi:hypothetical protein
MITDERRHVRELGLRRILKSRKSVYNSAQLRQFKVPLLNFDSLDYVDIIDWQNTEIHPPPILDDITEEELIILIKHDETPIVSFSRFPCHTQAVERCIKLVTEASVAVIGPDSRDGFICSRIQARKDNPDFTTTSRFRVN